MPASATTLREYVETGSEAAFARMVADHVDLVYSAALRIVGGDVQLARDVTQVVFADLARQAGSLSPDLVLGGWLYRHACFTACKAVRTERRRRAREQAAVSMQRLLDDTDSSWRQLAPVLDEAMARLDPRERDALVLRYFQNQPLRAVGEALGISEEAARKRVDRAVAALRTILTRRGVTLSAVTLTAALSAHSVTAAPVGLAAAVLAAGSAAGAASGTGLLAGLGRLALLVKIQAGLLSLVFLGGVVTALVLEPKPQAQAITQSATRPAPAQAPGGGVPNLAAAAEAAPANSALGRLTAWLRQADGPHAAGTFWELDQNQMRLLVWWLPAADYPSAWRLHAALRNKELRDQFAFCLLSYWAALDPHAAMAAAVSLPDAWELGSPRVVLEVWAEKEPRAALAWVRLAAPPKHQAAALAAVVEQTAKTDPELAIANLPEVGAARRAGMLADIVSWWAARAPSAAARYVAGLPASSQRYSLLHSTVEAWAERDPDAAWEWARGRTEPTEHAMVLTGALTGMGRLAPARAVVWVEQLEGEDLKVGQDCLPGIMENWALTKPVAAAQWTQRQWSRLAPAAGADSLPPLPPHGWLERTTEALLDKWGEADLPAAVAFANDLPDTRCRQERVEALLNQWSRQDLQAAMDWATALPDGPVRNAALKGLCQGLAGWNPVRAAGMVANLPAGELQSQAAVMVAQTWAQKDPKAAAQWVGTFPEGEARQGAAVAIVENWIASAQDPEAAGRWLETVAPGPTRERAARALVNELVARQQPTLAAPWVETITEAAERNEQIETIARQWLKTDPDHAAKWLQGTSLPEAAKRKVLGK